MAARQPLAPLPHEPPRSTRCRPVAEPCGSSTVSDGYVEVHMRIPRFCESKMRPYNVSLHRGAGLCGNPPGSLGRSKREEPSAAKTFEQVEPRAREAFVGRHGDNNYTNHSEAIRHGYEYHRQWLLRGGGM